MADKKPTLGEEMQSLLTGLQTALPAGTQSFPVVGAVQTVPAIIQKLGSFLSDWTAAEDSGLQHHADVQQRDANEPVARDFVNELKPAIFAVMGSKNPDLAKFGIKPREAKKKLTGEQRVAVTAKMRATRQARHTLGPRQKSQIKGVVTDVTPPPAGK